MLAFSFVVAFLCGCVAATAEIFSRYTHSPASIFHSKASYVYLALNGVASLIAYIIIRELGISFGPLGSSPVSQAILAGFSAMAILRSSIANIKHGQTTFEIGLAPVLQVFLDKVDRVFDQNRSKEELIEVGKIMADIDFIKAVKDLPITLINLMQHLSNEESERMGSAVLDLVKSEVSPQIKAINLGVILSKVAGTEFLRSAVDILGDSIRSVAQQPAASGQQQTLTYDEGRVERIRELKKKVL